LGNLLLTGSFKPIRFLLGKIIAGSVLRRVGPGKMTYWVFNRSFSPFAEAGVSAFPISCQIFAPAGWRPALGAVNK
jgi:hypothetical protein